MTLETFISIASLASLVYFAYGTWRISKTLDRVEEHLAAIEETIHQNLPPI